MQKTIRRLNHEYNDLLAAARKRLQGQRVRLKERKGRVQTLHLNAKGVRIDILYDDGSIEADVDALIPEYDPY